MTTPMYIPREGGWFGPHRVLHFILYILGVVAENQLIRCVAEVRGDGGGIGPELLLADGEGELVVLFEVGVAHKTIAVDPFRLVEPQQDEFPRFVELLRTCYEHPLEHIR